MRTPTLSLLALALFAAGCVTARPAGGGAGDSGPSQVRVHPAGEALVGPTWRLVGLRTAEGGTAAPEGDGAFTVSFTADGRVTGRADCNQYGGTYTAGPTGDLVAGDLVLSDAVTTLAACAPPSSSHDFFGTLNGVVGYDVAGGRLTLRAAGGSALVFQREGQGAAPDHGEPDFEGMPPQETGRDFAYTCDSPDGPFTFRIRTGPGEVALWLPERFEGREGGTYRVLGQVRAASGAKYQDGPVTVWTKGTETALLEIDGEAFLDCRHAPERSAWDDARRRGVDVRAVGQEPGWHIEITDGDRIRFAYAYGEREAVVPAPEPETRGGRTVYRAETEAHDLTVTLSPEPCTDAMSGNRFETTVTVVLDGETYRGCGRTLR